MDRRQLLLIIATALVAGLAFQGTRGLYETTEGRYAECAQEMLRSSHWLEPTLLEQPHWTKPPLAYWSIAGGIALLGHNAWGARLANALIFMLTAATVALLAGRLWDRRTALLAGLIYATSIYPVGAAFSISTDTLVTLWETLAVLCFWAAERPGTDRRIARRWLLGMWLAFALGFLTKGPPALMTLLPIIVFRMLDRDRHGKPRVFSPAGLLLFAGVGFSWYAYVSLRHAGLLGYFLGDEVVRRVATASFNRNPEWYRPFTLYLPLLLFGGGIWSWFLWRAIQTERLYRPAGWMTILEGRDHRLFLVSWVAVPLLVFSFSLSRMIDYVLPLYPAIALVAARQAARSWPAGPFPRRLAVILAVSLTLIVSGKAFVGYMPPVERDMAALYELVRADDHPGDTTFVFYEEREQPGFHFYARSEILRTTRTQARDAVTLTGFLKDVAQRHGPPHTYIFICEIEQAAELERKLRSSPSLPPSAIEKIQGRRDRNWYLARLQLPP